MTRIYLVPYLSAPSVRPGYHLPNISAPQLTQTPHR